MSLYLDKKYINLVSGSLEKFKWKKNNLANCRCPICGDSQTNKTKARGYFFGSDDAFFFKCHNCGISYNIYKFLELTSPSLFKQYCLERFKDRETKIEFISKPEKVIIVKSNITEYEIIDDLDETHKAIMFLESRKIPKKIWKKFYYTEHFAKLAKQFNESYDLIDDDRMVIPIFDEHNQMIAIQGRSFGKIQPRYITIKKDESIRPIYGIESIDKSKPIYVVEGPIDSLFLPNAIACLGSGNFLEVREKLLNQDLIFVPDNEPRNRNTVDLVQKLIEKREKVCIWPSFMKDKDINDMVLNGVDVCGILESHVHAGPSATLAFNSWRKI